MRETLALFAPEGASRALGRGRLLVVDDEPGVLRVLRLVLSPRHDLFTECRAEDALRRVVAGERFDLIFSDLMMPGMNGIELLVELGRIAPSQAERLVFLTGGAVTPAAQEFLATTTHHLIVKPFDVEEILAFVSTRLTDASPIS